MRHGESSLNKLRPGYCFRDEAERQAALDEIGSLGNQDAPLTELGVRQAEEAGKTILGLIGVPNVVYCSPYVRARQTLDVVAGQWPADRRPPRVVYDTRVRERESSPISSMTQVEVDRYFPWLQSYHDQVGAFYFRYPSGESLADLVDGRARSFIRCLNRRTVGENVLVVTHGNFIRCCRFILERWNPDRLRESGTEPVPNCGIYRYVAGFDGIDRTLRLVD